MTSIIHWENRAVRLISCIFLPSYIALIFVFPPFVLETVSLLLWQAVPFLWTLNSILSPSQRRFWVIPLFCFSNLWLLCRIILNSIQNAVVLIVLFKTFHLPDPHTSISLLLFFMVIYACWLIYLLPLCLKLAPYGFSITTTTPLTLMRSP